MALKIQRSLDRGVAVFTLSGRIDGARVTELQRLFDTEAEDHRIVLDLRDVDLVDRESVKFLMRCAANNIGLEHCPEYIRQWISRETA